MGDRLRLRSLPPAPVGDCNGRWLTDSVLCFDLLFPTAINVATVLAFERFDFFSQIDIHDEISL